MLVIRIDKGLEKDLDKDLIAMALETPNLVHTGVYEPSICGE